MPVTRTCRCWQTTPTPWPPMPTEAGTSRSCRRSTTTSAFRRRARCSMPTGRRTATSTACVRDAAAWVEGRKVAGLKLELIRLEGRTPLIFFEVPATRTDSTDTVVFYGHLDKQPEFNGWRNDLGPWTPKYENGKLYGRGGADDGYAVYAAITAIEALDRQGIARPRCVGLIESCEESGSPDLPAYLDVLKRAPGPGQPGGVPGQRRRQLRPAVAHHQPARHGQRRAEGRGADRGHPLAATPAALVPSSFRILRHLLDRLEDSVQRPAAAAELPLRDPGARASSRRAPPRRS